MSNYIGLNGKPVIYPEGTGANGMTTITPTDGETIIAEEVASIIPAKLRIIFYPLSGAVSTAALILSTQFTGGYRVADIAIGGFAAAFSMALSISHMPKGK